LVLVPHRFAKTGEAWQGGLERAELQLSTSCSSSAIQRSGQLPSRFEDRFELGEIPAD
jgi:hypothetical protein